MPNATMQKTRVNWVDTAKGIGIVLVVYEHVIRGVLNSGIMKWSATVEFLDSWIYAFHMPLFFFLSGLFLPASAKRPWGAFAIAKIRTLAYPYLLWSIITLSLKTILGPLPNQPDSLRDLPLILYQPVSQYWFLYVLFVLTLTVSLLLKLGMKPWSVLVLALLLYPGVLTTTYWGVVPSEARTYAIYLALGVIIGWYLSLLEISLTPIGWLIAAAALGLVISSLAGFGTAGSVQISDVPFAVSGVTATIAVSLLLEKYSFSAVFQFLGRYSLEIYVAHTIASAGMRIVLQHLAHVTSPSTQILLGTLAGLCIPAGLAVLLERAGFRFAFRIPSARVSNSTSPA